MYKFVNGEKMAMTEEEIAALQAETNRLNVVRQNQPMTESEVARLLIAQQINTLSVDDNTALRMIEFYPEWNSLIGQTVDKAGFRFICGGKLYKTIPANHTFQADWVPGVGTESIYTRIDETHDGTQSDPIPYDSNMELTEGLYYIQSGVAYLCTRGTGQPVYNPLAELVGIYVEEVLEKY